MSKAKPTPFTVQVHIISDATGTGSERVARTGLVQFRQSFTPHYIRHPFVRSTRQMAAILDQAEADQGMVIYNMTDGKRRQWLEDQKLKRRILIVDMLETLLDRVSLYYRAKPELSDRHLPQALGERGLKIARAVDFTMAHDDGQNLDTMGQAEVILLGVSRVSKTPTSFYLACHHGLKVANLPLIMGQEPPAKIFRLKKPRMVGLTINPGKLRRVRLARFARQAPPDYAELGRIMQELAFAEEIFERIAGITVIDVTERPVEEVCNLIV